MSNWRVKKGNTSIQEIPVYDRKGNLVKDLAEAAEKGYIKFQVKENPKDISPKIEKTTKDGIQVDKPEKGWLTITLVPKDTLIKATRYYMALEIKWTDKKLYETRLYIEQAETSEFEIESNIIHP